MKEPASTSRRALLGGVAALGAASMLRPGKAEAGPTALTYGGETIALWPGTAPGAPKVLPKEKIEQRSKDAAFDDRWITGVASPSLEVRRPAYRDGSAAIIIPGGGYGFLAWDNEGEEQANWLTRRGVTCFILKYRLPGEGWANRSLVPLQDAQRAVRLVRQQASDFGIDEKRIAVLGFSAGGHLAGSVTTRFDEKVYAPVDAADALSARPDLAGLIYPVISLVQNFTHAGSRDNLLGEGSSEASRRAGSVENCVTADTPPCFLVASGDDGLVPIENSLAMYRAMLAKQRPSEFHGFDRGGHGFGVRYKDDIPVHVWPELFHAYGVRHGVFGA